MAQQVRCPRKKGLDIPLLGSKLEPVIGHVIVNRSAYK
jgi:hypothetical protein